VFIAFQRSPLALFLSSTDTSIHMDKHSHIMNNNCYSQVCTATIKITHGCTLSKHCHRCIHRRIQLSHMLYLSRTSYISRRNSLQMTCIKLMTTFWKRYCVFRINVNHDDNACRPRNINWWWLIIKNSLFSLWYLRMLSTNFVLHLMSQFPTNKIYINLVNEFLNIFYVFHTELNH